MLLTGEQISYSRVIVNLEITANIMCSFRTNTRWYWSEITSNSMKISLKTFIPENQCIKVISVCSYKIGSFEIIQIYSCAKTLGDRLCCEITVYKSHDNCTLNAFNRFIVMNNDVLLLLMHFYQDTLVQKPSGSNSEIQ